MREVDLRNLIKTALLDARFTGWEDRDCGDEWDAVKAVAETQQEADRLMTIIGAVVEDGA